MPDPSAMASSLSFAAFAALAAFAAPVAFVTSVALVISMAFVTSQGRTERRAANRSRRLATRSGARLAAAALIAAHLGVIPQARAQDADSAVVETVSLDQVLESVDRYFPLLQATQDERQIRSGMRESRRGAFDARLGARADLRPVGFYQNYEGGAGVEQLTTLYGARLFGGYRIGSGDFPSYEGNRLTDDGGEISAGVEVPLLRGGAIDDARADLGRARIDLARADPEIASRRIEYALEASIAYWRWLAAGQHVRIATRLLGVAEKRGKQLEGLVEKGSEPRINLVDNERMVVDRRLKLRGARRELEQTAIELSIYLRDERGRPQLPVAEQLPAQFPDESPPDPDQFERDLARVVQEHPALAKLKLDRERLELDRDLAKNETLPRVDLRVEGAQDFGDAQPGIDTSGKLSPDPRSEGELKALIRFELPVQRREARGRLAALDAQIRQLDRRQQFARERITADVRRAIAGIEAAYDQTAQARLNLALAEELQRAEVRKLGLGTSNLINVNIRELQAASAALTFVEAQAEYFSSWADYSAAIARDI